jgi:hypothetical protein
MTRERDAAGSPLFPTILPTSAEIFPLSPSQEGFWSLEELIPGNAFSNLVFALRVTGEFDPAIVQKAFDEIIRRHAILRTTFATAGGHPIQVISPSSNFAVAVEDLRRFPEPEREQEFFRQALRDFHQPFDFTQAPLLRVRLFRIRRHEQLMVQTMHHIIGDSWSLQILNRELTLLYEAFSNGLPSPLPDLTVQYADATVWQRRLLEEKFLEGQRSYWKRKLDGGHLPAQDLPTDFSRSEAPTFKSSCQTITLAPSLSQALKNLGYQEGCTIFMVLVSVCKILLSKAMAQFDVRIGTVLANRNQSQIEELIGVFINTLLLRTDLSGNPTLRTILRRVRDTVLEALDHQDLPFEEVVRTLEHEGNLDRSSLVRVMFLFENTQSQPVDLSRLTIERMDIKGGLETNVTVTTFDLIFTFRETVDRLSGTLIYKTALFEANTIERLLSYFHAVAEWIATQPDVPLAALPSPRLGEKANRD